MDDRSFSNSGVGHGIPLRGRRQGVTCRRGLNVKRCILWSIVAGTLFVCAGGRIGYSKAVHPTYLTRVDLHNTPRFVRLKFHFKGTVPRHPKTVLHGSALSLFFQGVRKKGLTPPAPKTGGLIKTIRITGSSKGVRIWISLRSGHVEYVRYQRRSPPLVVVCLRKARRTRYPSRKTSPRTAHAKRPRKPRRRKALAHTVSRSQAHPPVYIPAYIPSPDLFLATPPEARIRFAEAREAWQTGHIHLAGKMFKEVYRHFPNSEEGEASAFYWIRSRLILNKGNPKGERKITKDLEAILTKYPHAPWVLRALRDLGSLYTRMGRYDRAIRTYRQIIARSPTSFDAENALVCIGKIQLATRSFKEAETTFREDLHRFPKGRETREATIYFGDALYYQGNIRQAIQVYQSAMRCRSRSTPTDLKALASLAALFEKRGNTDRALDLLFLALNLSPTPRNRKILLNQIMILYRHADRLKEVSALRSIEKPYLANNSGDISNRENHVEK